MIIRDRRSIGAARPDERWRAYTDQYQSLPHAEAAVQVYRRFLINERPRIVGGCYRETKVEMPILHLIGERDPVGARSVLAGYEPHAPNLKLEYIPACGHFLPEERPDVVLEKALPFLRG